MDPSDPPDLPDSSDITVLLQRIGQGDESAHNELLERVYAELRSLAQARLVGDRAERSLSVTALVHEAWIRLTPPDGRPAQWSNRGHFFSAAAEAMRRVLVDQARRRNALKRTPLEADRHSHQAGSPALPEAIDIMILDDDLLALDHALRQLEAVDMQAANIIKLRYFTGMLLQQIAETLDLSRATVSREIRFAKAWLKSRLESDA